MSREGQIRMTGGIRDFYHRRFNLILLLTILALTCVAWANRFVLDDAFISFRYSDHLAQGKGLVWNPGEQIEGYTNFLWTLTMGIPLYLGWDPVGFSFVLGLASFAMSLLVTYRLAVLIFGSRGAGLLTIVLLGTNYTFSAFATSGLETQFQTFLVTASTCILLRMIRWEKWPAQSLATLSILLATALLTRPDSALLAAVIVPLTLVCVWRREPSWPGRWTKTVVLILPAAVLVGAWLVWKLSYYGDLFPNSFYAKVSSSTSFVRGAHYLWWFLLSYLLIPFPFLALLRMRDPDRKPNPLILIPFTLVALWMLYVCRVGGDFMEFRMIVPVMPLVFVLLMWIIFRCIRDSSVRVALVVLILAGSVYHALTFDARAQGGGIESVPQMVRHLDSPDENWDEVGRVLGSVLGHDPDVTIATTAAGAIPYFSHLKAIDMFGVNDPWIAKNGVVVTSRPGHQIVPTLGYLMDRNVHLVIGHPRLVPRGPNGPPADLRSFHDFYISVQDPGRVPSTVRILRIPIDDEYDLAVLYLNESASVEEAIRRYGWKVYWIRPTG